MTLGEIIGGVCVYITLNFLLLIIEANNDCGMVMWIDKYDPKSVHCVPSASRETFVIAFIIGLLFAIPRLLYVCLRLLRVAIVKGGPVLVSGAWHGPRFLWRGIRGIFFPNTLPKVKVVKRDRK